MKQVILLVLCLCLIFTGCGNKQESQVKWSSISQEELDKLTESINHIDDVEDTEESIGSTECTAEDNYNKTDKNSSIVMSYLESYDWNQLPVKKSFKELDALAPIHENMEELLNGMYRINGHELTKQDIIPDNGMSIYILRTRYVGKYE